MHDWLILFQLTNFLFRCCYVIVFFFDISNMETKAEVTLSMSQSNEMKKQTTSYEAQLNTNILTKKKDIVLYTKLK